MSGIAFLAGLLFIPEFGLAGANIAQITVTVVQVVGFAAIIIKSIGLQGRAHQLEQARGGSAKPLNESRTLREEVQ
jgi:hypothetical protein